MLEAIKHIHLVQLTTDMQPEDIARKVEDVFTNAGTPLPATWYWAVLTVHTRRFESGRLHVPWQTELKSLRELYSGESMAFVVPGGWADPKNDNRSFRLNMATAIERDPVSWMDLRKGKQRSISVVDSDEEDDVKPEIERPKPKPKAKKGLAACTWCKASFPADRMAVHRDQCAERAFYQSDDSDVVDLTPLPELKDVVSSSSHGEPKRSFKSRQEPGE